MIRNGEVIDYARSMFKDQRDWLATAMKRLMPAKLHYMIDQGHVSNGQVKQWLTDNGVQITFFRNVPMIRITVKGVLFDEWKFRPQVDGRPVDIGKLVDPRFADDDIYVDEKTTQENN